MLFGLPPPPQTEEEPPGPVPLSHGETSFRYGRAGRNFDMLILFRNHSERRCCRRVSRRRMLSRTSSPCSASLDEPLTRLLNFEILTSDPSDIDPLSVRDGYPVNAFLGIKSQDPMTEHIILRIAFCDGEKMLITTPSVTQAARTTDYIFPIMFAIVGGCESKDSGTQRSRSTLALVRIHIDIHKQRQA